MNAILFCGLATAVGWGLRGEYGGMGGASIPGAILGISLALTCLRPEQWRQAAALGGIGALAMAMGGMMSYGRVIGYTKGIDLPNVTYGYAMLGVIGGLWGAFAAGAMAMVVSPIRYQVWKVIALLVSIYAASWLTHWALIDLGGIRMTPPRGDAWANMLGACIALLAFILICRDFIAARMFFWGATAGAAGFMIGELFQVVGSSIGPDYDWWKVMEQTFGFILGAGIAFGFRSETESRPLAPWLVALCIAIAAVLVPLITLGDTLDHLAENGGTKLTGMLVARLIFLTVLAIGAVAYFKYRPVPASRTITMTLFLWVLWSCMILGVLKKSAPEWQGHSTWVHNGFFAIAIALSIWCLVGFRDPVESPTQRAIRRWIAASAVAFPLLAVTLAALSIASHPGEWRTDAHVRFGEEPVPEQQQAH